jgi:hypothetical protein
MAAGGAADSAAARGAKRAPSPNPAAKAAVAKLTESTRVLLRMVCLSSFLIACQDGPPCRGPSYVNNRWRDGFLPDFHVNCSLYKWAAPAAKGWPALVLASNNHSVEGPTPGLSSRHERNRVPGL